MIRYLTDFKYYACRGLLKAGLLKYLNLSLTKKIHNKRFRIPVINTAGYSNLSSNYESWFDAFLVKILPAEKPVIVDVGVNIGQTILKLAAIRDDIRYLGFEPNPICYSYSRKLIELNKLDNYSVFPVGLSEKFELLSLYGDNDYAAGASVIKDFRQNTKRYSNIQMVTLAKGDDVIEKENLEKIDFLKADVEGAELEVMIGLKQTIEKYRPFVMLEILPCYSLDNENGRKRKNRQDQLLNLMRSYDYEMFLIEEKKASLSKIMDIPVHGDMSQTNYFFIPTEKPGVLRHLLD